MDIHKTARSNTPHSIYPNRGKVGRICSKIRTILSALIQAAALLGDICFETALNFKCDHYLTRHLLKFATVGSKCNDAHRQTLCNPTHRRLTMSFTDLSVGSLP